LAKKARKKKKKIVEDLIDFRSQLAELGSRILEVSDLERKPGHALLTGVMPLDLIVSSGGGLHPGCVEFYGHEGVGKTSMALSIVRSAVAAERPSLYVDVEQGMTEELCQIFDLRANKDFILSWPDNAEAALNGAERFLRVAKKGVIIIDSIPNLLSAGEWDEKVETKSFNPVSLMLSKFAKRASAFCRRSGTILVYLNQIRDNMEKYGPSIRVPGPRAVKFACAVRVEMKVIGKLKESGENGEIIGQKVKFKTIKNRSTRPFQEAESSLIYGHGFHQGHDLCEIATMLGLKNLVNRSGAWYELMGGEKVMGQAKAAEAIVSNPDLMEKIRKGIIEASV